MSVILTLLIFTVIVVIHEAGHLVAAKKFNVLVTEFSVGMGPKLCGFKKGDTAYNIRILPIGGFCRMEETTDREDVIAFNDTTPIQKIIISFAGPFMNFVLAFVLMVSIGLCTPLTNTHIVSVNEGSPAQSAGLEAGDVITGINSHSVHTREEFEFYKNGGEAADTITIRRNGRKLDYVVKPELSQGRYIYGIGLSLKAPYLNIMGYDIPDGIVKGSLWEYFLSGFWSVIALIKITVVSFVRLVSSKIAVTELSGPIGVTSAVGEVYTDSVSYGLTAVILSMLQLTVLLSANLGVINLFPIPALDGGRIVIGFLELITGRKIPPNIEGFIHFIGFALLMALGIYIAYNDVLKLI